MRSSVASLTNLYRSKRSLSYTGSSECTRRDRTNPRSGLEDVIHDNLRPPDPAPSMQTKGRKSNLKKCVYPTPPSADQTPGRPKTLVPWIPMANWSSLKTWRRRETELSAMRVRWGFARPARKSSLQSQIRMAHPRPSASGGMRCIHRPPTSSSP